MKILQRRLVRIAAAAVAVVGLGAVIVAPTGASAAIVTTPLGLSPGDPYRLAFVTSTTRDPTSSDIGVYNAFVTTAANSQADLLALGATWTAIGSTSTVDARDNTGTNPSSPGVPIFLLDGTKIADNNADLWDGTIDAFFNIFVDATLTGALFIFTGTSSDGTGAVGVELGSPATTFPIPLSIFGNTTFANAAWISDGPAGQIGELSFYALSSPLTVAAVPLPGALILFGSGLACLAVLRRRSRSVRPA